MYYILLNLKNARIFHFLLYLAESRKSLRKLLRGLTLDFAFAKSPFGALFISFMNRAG